MAMVTIEFRRWDWILVLRGLAVGVFVVLAAGPVTSGEPTTRRALPQVAAEGTSPPADIADLKALEGRIQAVVSKVAPSVVSISGGSGVVINREGYVLTVAHVGRRSGRNVTVIFPDGRRARGITLGNDQGVDAGMVKITDEGPWPCAEMGRSSDLKPGQWCLTLGYPVMFERGKPPLVRIGRVLSSRKTEVITDCTIMGGDSGAPLFNLDGKVIAIGSKCDTSLVHNIHVPIDRFRDGWELLAKGKDFNTLSPMWVWLGVLVGEDVEEARIETVAPGSGAETAGLKPGDLLLKVAGHDLRNREELRPLLQQRKPGDQVEVEFRRGEETLKVPVRFGQSRAGQGP